ncbi:MAG: hypothetical protein FJX40_10745 [Alphaproteobacteria bacterium]|jgi:hypothetical protein|nr:hypothetical protein [Alphaproteobacteria bacterium]MBM3640541.1 hypothetical protein [Alphaproteobacteria bacterium]
MSTSARLSLVAAFLIAAGLHAASAQQLQVDPGALDASGSVSAQPKAKKAKAQQSQGASQQKQGSGDRQFGELEGWSPGKAPPGKQKEEGTPSSPSGNMPIGVSPSGNMSVGLPF